jgi:MoaA/NifB/PqqE/SkfB family radical SAM enzyme
MYSHKKNRITVDVTNKCTNLCPGCARQKDWNNGKNIPGEELSIKSWEMFTDYFDAIGMCGQISDPTLHHDFHALLEIAMKKKCKFKHTYCSNLPIKRMVYSIFSIDSRI